MKGCKGPMSFGSRLRELRIKRGETLRDFCLKLGVDPSTYSKIENDKTSPPPNYEKCKGFLDALGIEEKQKPLLLELAYNHHLGRFKEKWGSK